MKKRSESYLSPISLTKTRWFYVSKSGASVDFVNQTPAVITKLKFSQIKRMYRAMKLRKAAK